MDKWLRWLDEEHERDLWFEIDGQASGELAADIRRLMALNERFKTALQKIDRMESLNPHDIVGIARKALTDAMLEARKEKK
jgi:hypothetical protein